MSLELRKYLTVIILLAVAVVFVLRATYKDDTNLETVEVKTFPLEISSWKAMEIPVSEHVRKVLGTDSVLTRMYEDPQGDQVMLAIIYSDNNRDSFHPPELCYIGAGTELLAQTTEEIELNSGEKLKANALVMNAGRQQIAAWYWFMVNERFITNYYMQQAYLFLEAVRGRPLKGAMVRISVEGENEALKAKAKGFIREISPILKNLFKS